MTLLANVPTLLVQDCVTACAPLPAKEKIPRYLFDENETSMFIIVCTSIVSDSCVDQMIYRTQGLFAMQLTSDLSVSLSSPCDLL